MRQHNYIIPCFEKMIGKVLFVTKDYSGDVDIKLLCLDTNLASRRIISNRNMKRVLNFLSDILKFAHLCDLFMFMMIIAQFKST